MQRRGGHGVQGEAVRLIPWAATTGNYSLIGGRSGGRVGAMNEASAGSLSTSFGQPACETTYENSDTKRYLDHVQEWVVVPAQTTSLKESCFASALLIFAGIEGLGNLLWEGTKKIDKKTLENRDLFGAGLKCFPQKYRDIEDVNEKEGKADKKSDRGLWKLRCGLAHFLGNRWWAMSHLKEEECRHLEFVKDGVRLLHTPTLVHDFELALREVDELFRSDPKRLATANARFAEPPWPNDEPSPGTTTRTSTPAGPNFDPKTF